MLPACSPTASMSVIMRGNAPDAASGPEMDVPSVTRLRALARAWPITALPHVSSEILSAWSTLTPFESRVFSVKAREA